MSITDMGSLETCADQLRKLVRIGPRKDDYAAADLAETLIKQLTAHMPLVAKENAGAAQLIDELRGFFLDQNPSFKKATEYARDDFTRRIEVLKQAVSRYR